MICVICGNNIFENELVSEEQTLFSSGMINAGKNLHCCYHCSVSGNQGELATNDNQFLQENYSTATF